MLIAIFGVITVGLFLVTVWFLLATIAIWKRTDYFDEQTRRVLAGLPESPYRPGILDRFFTFVGMMKPMEAKYLEPGRAA